MKHYLIFILSLSLLALQSLQAQKKWNLDECIAYALEHNLQLNDFDLTEDSNKETYRQSVRELLPTVNGATNYNINYGRSVDPDDNSFINTDFFSNNYSIGASVDLFRGFQKMNAIKASKFLYLAAQEDLVQQKYLLAFRVMSAYYDIHFFQGMVTNSKEQLGISEANYALVEKQVELGLKAGADLYEAESLLLTDQLTLTQNENALETAVLVLSREMNLTDTADLELTPYLETAQKLDTVQNLDKEDVFETAMGFVPMIQAQKHRLAAAKKSLAQARGSLSPTLALNAGWQTGYFETRTDSETGEVLPFKNQFKDNANSYVGASLNIPISNRWSRRSQVKQQKIALERAKNQMDVQEQELYNIVQKLVQDHRSFSDQLAQSYKQMESQELAFTIAQKRYEKGLINALELTQAKNLFANAQNENLQVRLRKIVNQSTLDFYRGVSELNIN
ncbi:TolC family protein [Sediminicola luteus]|uniref:Transporter n=1 Tax=Sediminicola luteus TaxID=319238 RepID=A0A2A4GEK3_9FLAO|nr:TolC family protein [Sediminicola luteus]PCE66172.1 transporter [Sediminicola luteus]